MTAPSYSRKNIHAFDQDLAIKIGLKPAIVFQHVKYWLDFNVKNEKSWKKGRVWMYETQEDMAEFLGYLSKKEVRESLELLNQEGYLDREKLSANPFDQTWWYAIPVEKSEKSQNSNSSYESNEKAPSEGHFLSPSEGHKKAPSIIRTIKDKEKEQQQAAPPTADVFSCIKEFSFEKDAIDQLMKFHEARVNLAVAFVKAQGAKAKNIPGLLIWHCKQDDPPLPALSKEDVFEKNKVWAKKEEKEWERTKKGFKFEALNKCCELIVGGQIGSHHFSYEDVNMIESIKQKRGY